MPDLKAACHVGYLVVAEFIVFEIDHVERDVRLHGVFASIIAVHSSLLVG